MHIMSVLGTRKQNLHLCAKSRRKLLILNNYA